MDRTPANGGRDGEAGATLVEVLVALILLALIGGAGFAVLDQVLRVQARTDGRLERLAEIQRTMHLLAEDFMQAKGGSLAFADGTVAFRRSGGPGGATVRYGAEGAALTRSVRAGSGQARQTMLSGLDAMRWQFYAPETGWIDTWPPDPAKPAANPAAVSLHVRLTGAGLSGELVRIAPLPAEVGP